MGQILGLNTSGYNATPVATKKTEVKKENVTNKDEQKSNTDTDATVKTNASGDTLEVSKKTDTNSKNKVDEKQLAKLLEEANDQTTKFNNFINKILGNQSKNILYAHANGNLNGAMSYEDLEASVADLKTGLETGTLVVSQEDIDKARELTSEDGYYGVKQTSARILEFAKAISGGDTSKAEMLREAVQKGFDSAAKLWGGMEKAPQITKDTYDTVMKGFDEWVNGTATK